MHVLPSRCHVSVPFDPASPLRKERMVRVVPRDRGRSLAAIIADFCNNILPKPDSYTAAKASLLDHLVGAQQDRSRQFNADCLGGPEVHRELKSVRAPCRLASFFR